MAHLGASRSTTTVADGRPCKLRQTCDSCSEAKVKCDKGNPRCGRCDRLLYDCVYSPARRIGRPRPRSRRSPRTDQDGTCRRRPACHSRDDSASVTNDSAHKDRYRAPARTAPAPSASTPTPALAQLAQQIPTTRHPNLDLDELLPDSLSDEGRGRAPAGSASSASSSARSNDVIHSSRTSTTSSSSSSSSSLEQPSSLGMDEVRHDLYEYDCAAVAVATLRRLAAVGLVDGQQQPATTTTTTTTTTLTSSTAAADVLADQIPHACRQAARILVCPCSTDMDTALLAASLAAAILDVAEAAMRSLRPAGRALDDEKHTLLALGTLPSISQVVTLFTHRYSATQLGRPPGAALLLLAASLRAMLKAMAEETTNRFLDSGATPFSHRGGN